MSSSPIGFVTLFEAVDTVGRILFGEAWQYAIRLDDPDAEKENAPPERVITVIAEGCEGGRIAAAYRTITGVHELDLAVWRSPSWRRYFERGEIDLDLPLLDENWRPHELGFTSRCPCEIFVRRDSLDGFIKTLTPQAVTTTRYPSDAALIQEGLALLAKGMSDRAAARQLAQRAEGAGTLESKIDRLRTKLSDERKRQSNPTSG